MPLILFNQSVRTAHAQSTEVVCMLLTDYDYNPVLQGSLSGISLCLFLFYPRRRRQSALH